jgi:hypothetical protein
VNKWRRQHKAKTARILARHRVARRVLFNVMRASIVAQALARLQAIRCSPAPAPLRAVAAAEVALQAVESLRRAGATSGPKTP